MRLDICGIVRPNIVVNSLYEAIHCPFKICCCNSCILMETVLYCIKCPTITYGEARNPCYIREICNEAIEVF